LKILGIHDGHNSSAAIVEDGAVVAAVQEERLTRHKNQGGFPVNAIKEVLTISGLSIEDIDQFAFSGHGKSKVKNRQDILANYLRKVELPEPAFSKKIARTFRHSVLAKSKRQRKLKRKQRARMAPLLADGTQENKVRFIEHHLCHASAAYYGQGNMNDEILVLTCDAAGDGICATVNIGKNGKLKRLASIPLTESVPIFYSLLTFLTGFIPLEHEYKLMGLAPYSFGSEQSHHICNYLLSHFCFTEENPLGWQRADGIVDTFRIGPQLKKLIEYKRFDNVAAGLQLFIEDFFVKWIRRVIRETAVKKLALSGGLFMNVKLNKLIMELDEVESLFVFPSCGDETNNIGAAWAAYADYLNESKRPVTIPQLGAFCLGADVSVQEVECAISDFDFNKNIRISSYENIEKKCAELLAQNQVVARCKGRMEFGARALGNRSILANPGNWKTVKVINEMIKMRDFWMPFAPSILSECALDYIHNPKYIKAPYMVLAFETKKDKLDKIIASVHPYDHSCRPQVVEKEWNPDYHRLINCYKDLTGEGAILNTSFNLHGLPIVYKPTDALEVFDKSGLRYLALGNVLIEEV